MKPQTLIILCFNLLALLRATNAFTAEPVTVAYNHDKLVANQGIRPSIEYGNLRQIQVLIGLSLPVQTALVALHHGESLENIVAASGDSTMIDIAAPRSTLEDEVTSSEDAYASAVHEQNVVDRLGARSVTVLGEMIIDHRRFADLLIFPVTFDSSGSLWFHSSLSVAISGRTLTTSELLPRNEFVSRDNVSVEAGASATESEYLLVTSAALADAMQPLVRYKSETGYRAELDTVESILALYSGRDDAEKLRERLKVFHADGGKYVLLAGDETVLPIRYAYPNLATSMPPLDQMQVCDLYFADLTGDWDADHDGVWGERYTDGVDIIPELLVGRLPINTPEEAGNYIAKLIQYETDPGAGDREYLERAFFYSSDQMRDYDDGGQHGSIARAYPSWFAVDTVSAVERSTGADLDPSNLSASELAPVLASGFGIINIVAHGRSDGFVLKSSGYNEWPKTYILSDNGDTGHGELDSLGVAGKPGFYYSLACNNGGFDMDQPPMNQINPSVVQELIGGPSGAVGMVAYSRWGWISSSYLLQTAFFDSLFAHPEQPALEALYASKTVVYYYRDLVYGLNFYGDPTLKVYTHRPDKPEITIATEGTSLGVVVATDGIGIADCQVILSRDGEVLFEQTADGDGQVLVEQVLEPTALYRLAALFDGSCVAVADFIPSMVTGVDGDEPGLALPDRFALHQNYPNPFNPTTTISYDLPASDRVHLAVFNLLGQTVATLVDGHQSAGSYTVAWNGTDREGESLASGVYFYRLETERTTSVRKMLLMK